MTCAICHIRKPKRDCPGVRGEICSICCAREREETVDCPFDCVWLRDAHKNQKPSDLERAQIPNHDVNITEEFLEQNEILLAFTAVSLFEAWLEKPAATDWDVREALEALISTWRTLQSGIYYESRPDNTFAAAIAAHLKKKIDDVRDREVKERGSSSIRDSAILNVFIFLQRLEYMHNNGRKRSRAFLDFLRGFYAPEIEEKEESIVEPKEPLIIL